MNAYVTKNSPFTGLYPTAQQGFTLIEVVLVVIVTGILVSVAMRGSKKIADTARVEETKQELEALSWAIIGNAALENSGSRSDFGYVGDVGSLPSNLDNLVTNPGSYATWNGPYIQNRFTQSTDDYKRDAWASLYSYSGGLTITSTGSGSNIVQKLAGSTDHLLLNSLTGAVFDLDGSSPGNIYKDSVSVRLTIPDGSGATLTKTTSPDAGGYFSFDSIAIGNHDIEVIYLPFNDTLRRFVSVLPNSSLYSEYRLGSNVWSHSLALRYVPGSAQTSNDDCDRIEFEIINMSPNPVTVSGITLTWSTPTGYYEKIEWDGDGVFDEDNPRAGAGEIAPFDNTETVDSGEKIEIRVEKFRDVATGGGNDVDMSNTLMIVEFSDGSLIFFNTGICN